VLGAVGREDPATLIARLEGEMLEAARALEFERAASLRDRIDDVRAEAAIAPGAPRAAGDGGRPGSRRRHPARRRG